MKKENLSVLTIGGATQDIYVRFHGADSMKITRNTGESRYMLFESDAKIEVEKLSYFTGGGATNSSVTFSCQGIATTCFCMIGNDEAGKNVLDDLKRYKVNADCVVKSDEHPTGKSFVVNAVDGERTIFAHRGANRFLKKELVPFNVMKNVDQVYITSLSQEAALLLPDIVSFAKENKKSVAINPGISLLSSGALVLRDSLRYIDILILNSSEARTFMVALVEKEDIYKDVFLSQNKKIKKSNSCDANLLHQPILYENVRFGIRKFFLEVFKMGPKIVVVTDGERGVYVATPENILFHAGLEIDAVDTLGAGDAFGACFVASLLRGEEIKDALRDGMINSASVIGKFGAKPGVLTLDELNDKISKFSQGNIEELSF